jgi:ABC-2 type transport system ATP-binding protein
MAEIALEIRNLTKCYGSLVAVRNLTLTVYAGEILGLLGPNGAGKTTSIDMICGLLKPDGGQALLRGRPLQGGDPDARARVGLCPQTIVLWERLTCLEQLQFIGEMYGLRGGVARRRGLQLLDDLGLAEQRSRLARTLSGGMQRRLNLAMALVHDPEVVILDEPEAGLDPQSRIRVREYVASLAGRKTVILTTHNMDEADRLVGRVAIIDHGELLVLDTPEALKQRLGEGDTVEIRLPEGSPDEGRARGALQGLAGGIQLAADGRSLRLRALQALARLQAILDALTSNGFQPGEVSIRANTLEDVFIQLTGRGLRE